MNEINRDLKISLDLLLLQPFDTIIKEKNLTLINKIKDSKFSSYYLPSYIYGVLNTCEVANNFNESNSKNKEKLLKIIEETDLYKDYLNFNDAVTNIFTISLDVAVSLRDRFIKVISIDEDPTLVTFQFINGDFSNLSKTRLLDMIKLMDKKNELNIDEDLEKYVCMVHGFSHAIADMKTIYRTDKIILDIDKKLKKSPFNYLISDTYLDSSTEPKKFYLLSELYETDKFFTKEIINQYDKKYPEEMLNLNIYKMINEMLDEIKKI